MINMLHDKNSAP